MQLKNLLTKSLLVAGMLAGSSSAWADAGDETTVVDIDFSNAISEGVVAGTKGSMVLSNTTGTNPYVISDGTTQLLQGNYAPPAGWLVCGKGTGTVTIAEADRVGYGKAKNWDKLKVTFTMAWGHLNNRLGGFRIKDAEGNNLASLQYTTYSSKFGDNSFGLIASELNTTSSNQANPARVTNFTIIFDYKAGTISCKTNYMEDEKIISMPIEKPQVASFVVDCNWENDARRGLFDNLVIKNIEGDYSVSTANYKVQYKCGSDEIKTEDTREGDVGASISLLGTDKANFFNGDESKRYIYVDDDADDYTIEGDGSTIVTVNFREAAKWSYNVTSSCSGDALAFTTSGSVWEDLNTVKVRYPKFQANGTTLVYGPCGDGTGDPVKTITIANNAYEEDIVYTASGITNLYLLSEAEDLGTGLATNGTSFTDRVSSGLIAYGASGKLLTLPAGKYIFTLGVIGGDNDTHKVAYTVNAGATEIISGTCTGNTLLKFTSSEFTLNTSTDITFTSSDAASSRGIDLVYVQKTGDLTEVTGTIPSSGIATLASDYGLDFSNATNLTGAYVVSNITADAAELTPVNELPANNGVILFGNAGDEYSIPVKADATFAGTNKLKAAVAATAIAANEAYILQAGEFHLVNAASTIPAGKAYLLAEDVPALAPSLMFVFSGMETTAINDVRGKTEDVKGDFFNLNGQRVAQPTKGLYIVNGKKVIIK